jgi:hypothetical protein
VELIVDVAGWLGAAGLLAAYAMVSSGRLDGRCASFQVLNVVGSAGLIANSGYNGAWPSTALNGVWLVVGLVALWRLSRAARRRGAAR